METSLQQRPDVDFTGNFRDFLKKMEGPENFLAFDQHISEKTDVIKNLLLRRASYMENFHTTPRRANRVRDPF